MFISADLAFLKCHILLLIFFHSIAKMRNLSKNQLDCQINYRFVCTGQLNCVRLDWLQCSTNSDWGMGSWKYKHRWFCGSFYWDTIVGIFNISVAISFIWPDIKKQTSVKWLNTCTAWEKFSGKLPQLAAVHLCQLVQSFSTPANTRSQKVTQEFLAYFLNYLASNKMTQHS